MNAEDQNYTLFNYVNEVNAEIEKLEDQITAIKAEIERFRGEVSRPAGCSCGSAKQQAGLTSGSLLLPAAPTAVW